MLSSPVKMLQPSNVAHTGERKYKSEPEFPTFTTSFGRCAFFPAPNTSHFRGEVNSIFAPMSGTASAALRQSALPSGFRICEVPSAKADKMSARIVWLFEPGTVMLPERMCGVEEILMARL